jgi:HAD superfamily hydrolase (TIGR01509 family)
MPHTPASIAAVAFDLDGTLVDTTRLHVNASQAASLAVFGVPVAPHVVAHSLGRPLPDSMRVISQGRGREPDLLAAFLHHYSEHESDGAQCFPGVTAMLGALQHAGVRLGLLSNKLRAWGQTEITRLRLTPYFSSVVFMEDMPAPKPSGLALQPVARQLGVAPAKLLVIGDSAGDIMCAHAAGAHSGAAVWGAYDAELVLAAKPQYVFHDLGEVLALFHLASSA